MKIFVLNKYTALVILIAVFITVALLPISIKLSRPAASPPGENLPVYSVETNEKKAAVTFNCAWGDEDIDSILSALHAANAKCTFFIVGTWAEKYPDAVRKIHEAGHEIGSHGYDHSHYGKMSAEEIASDMEKGRKVLEEITGTPCLLFRAPYGEYTKEAVALAKERGQTMIQWNVDSVDYEGLDTAKMKERILNRLGPGAILLFHTGTDNTAKALPALLETIKAEGFSFSTVGEMLLPAPYEIDHQGRQKKSGE